MTRFALAGLALALFAVVATANSGGYRYGASDQAFYLPAVAAELDPSLFPRDRELLEPHKRLWAGDTLIADVARVTGVGLPTLFLALYGVTLVVLAAGAMRLGRSLDCDWWAIALFLVLLTLRHRIAKTGANTLEGYMHPRMIAFGCGLFVFAEILKGRLLAGFALAGLAVLIHTPTGVWFAATWAAAVLWRWRGHRGLVVTVGIIGLALGVATMIGLRGQLVTMDAEWLGVLGEKDYLFPTEWPLYAWGINLLYPVVLGAIFVRRRARGLASEGESALMAGLFALVAAFLLSLPLSHARLALAVQIQINRIFWLLDAVTLLYVSWWATSDLAIRWSTRARSALVAVLALLACGRGYYVLKVEARRPFLEIGLAPTPWNDAMTWLSRQPSSWHVLADPQHAWKFGPSVRVAALRDTLLEASKDAALAMYDRRVAARVAERSRALGGFETFGVDDVRQLAARYGLDVFVDRNSRTLPLPVLYRNVDFVVYDLPVMTYSAPADTPVTPTPGHWTSRPFVPRRFLGNGHVMTVFAWAHRRTFPSLPEPEARLIRVSPDTQVLAHCHWQPERHAHPTLLALHGLEGSSSVHYMRGLADKALRLGWNVVRLNQRNCGGTEHLTPSLYHSGLTDDPRAVMRSLASTDGLGAFGLVGYSLGGNLTMKLAGELADHPDVPVFAAVAICPTIDLQQCVAAIERRRNFVYEFNFVRNLKARMRRKDLAWPGLFDLSALDRVRTIRAFDDGYTAPHHGFGDATNYYFRASALRVVDRIRLPTLVLSAEDDPFVPAAQFAHEAVRDNPHVTVHLAPRGGHCAFVTSPDIEPDGYWAEAEAIRFLSAFTPPSGSASPLPR